MNAKRYACRFFTSCTVALSLLSVSTSASSYSGSDTLERVRERGVVICGVNTDLKGFSQANSLGVYSGLDADLCRAIASAVFNDPDAAEFIPLNAAERFPALKEGIIDVLTRNTTWTLERNTTQGTFTGVNYYDGQGFMVHKASGFRSALELNNVPICVSKGTTTELNAIDFFKVSKMRYKPAYFDSAREAAEAYIAGKCDVLTTDRSALAAMRTTFPIPDAHVVLPEVISKEPLGPMVRFGDEGWANIVRWTLNCMINAEEMGISSTNIAQAESNDLPAVRRLLGFEGDFGNMLGLDQGWCGSVIKYIGNYAESYEKNVGENTDIGLPRGVNSLWTDGGLIYAPPIR